MLRALRRDGWFIVRQKGSHAMLRHAEKSGLLVVPRDRGRILGTGLTADILQDAGLTAEELHELL
jgi:predicted RNA binding protein YcfA (HicA-like mRNA interferase family)